MAVYHEGAYYDALLDYQNEMYMECTNNKYDIDKNKKLIEKMIDDCLPMARDILKLMEENNYYRHDIHISRRKKKSKCDLLRKEINRVEEAMRNHDYRENDIYLIEDHNHLKKILKNEIPAFINEIKGMIPSNL